MVKIEVKHPYIYSINIRIKQPYVILRIGGILFNYLTNNERAIFTQTNIFENDKNYHGVEIKVFDYNPSKSKTINDRNAITLAKLLLYAFGEECVMVQIKTKVLIIYNDKF